MTTKTTLIVGSDLIKKEIEGITKADKKLDDRIQVCGLSILDHIAQHGDITLANKLFLGMPKGSRRNALAEWFLAHGKLELNVDAGTKKEAPFLYAKAKETKLELAEQTPWYNFAPEKAVDTVFDLSAALANIWKKAQAAQASGKEIKGLDKLEQLAKLAEGVK